MTDDFTEGVRTGYAVVIAALRDDDTAIRALLEPLTPAQIAAVCEGSLLAMAQTLRDTLPDTDIRNMIHAVQHLALHEGN